MWKFFLKDLIRIRYILPLSFALALLSGFSNEFSEFMALGRFVCFLPFFLSGYFCTSEQVGRIRKVPKLLSVLLLMLVGSWSAFVAYKDLFDTEILFLRTYYPKGEGLHTLLYRLIIYIVAFVMIFVLLNLASSRKTFLSHVGASTITVYVLHVFTIPVLEKLKILENKPVYYLVYSVLMTLLITYIYSRPIVKRVYDCGMDKLSGLLIKDKVKNTAEAALHRREKDFRCSN
jgi:fucose 4-O-acetylase-like acetyltransferase